VLDETGAENISSRREPAADHENTDRPMHRRAFG
jgi:hypothetical protein